MKKISTFGNLLITLAMSLAFSAGIAGVTCNYLDKPELTILFTGLLFAVSIVAPMPKGIIFMAFTQGICEKVQSSLVEILGSNTPSLKRTKVGYLSALQSPQNLAGVTKVPIDPGTGKKKTVRIKFIQRATEADVQETEITDCSTEVERTPFETDVEITRYVRSPGLKFDENEMRKLCEADSAYMQGVINAEMDAVIKFLNKKLITIQNANFGNFNPVEVPNFKSVVLLTGKKQIPNYKGESDIIQSFEDIDAMGRPIVVGHGNLSHYVRQTGIGCCNQDGIDLNRAGNLDYYTDRYVEGIIGANCFIGLEPGMVQLLTWNKYVGVYRKENDVFSHSTIVDPISGLTFDMKWHYDDCADVYSVFFGLHYDMFFIPTNSFKAGDELAGVNGSLKFQGLSEEDYCC
jgi:hypothetical protein